MCLSRSALVWYINSLVRNVIPFILAKHLAILSTRVREHLFTDKNSHIFKHLTSPSSFRDACGEGCFKVLESASTHHSLKIKEALNIMRERPNLNKQLQQYNV